MRKAPHEGSIDSGRPQCRAGTGCEGCRSDGRVDPAHGAKASDRMPDRPDLCEGRFRMLQGIDPVHGEQGRGRDGLSPRRARAAPRTDPSEQNYRTGLLPRVRTSNRSSGQGCVTRARGLRAVRSTVQSRVQPLEVVLEVRRVLLPRHAVDAGSGLPLILKLKERLTESVDCDVMKERRELRAPVLPCFLTYTVERTWRANCPAMRPGRVLPVRVPLGQAPYLHPLRRGRLRFVPLLRRYYGPVRLPRAVRHRRTATGLSDAARGTIRRGRLGDLPVLAHGDSARARGLRPRRAARRLAITTTLVWPSASEDSVGALVGLISRLDTLPVRTPVNASPPSSRTAAYDSGTSWFAIPSTLDSFIPFSMPVYPGAPSLRSV